MIPPALPDLDALDSEALKALVIAQHSELLDQRKSNEQEIERLKLIIEKYRRMIFGRKSEKLTGQLEQLEFRLEELEIAQAADEAAQAATEAVQRSSTPTSTKPRSRPARKPLPEDLPREVITHLPAHNCCPDCGGALRQFGEDVSEQLERIPASYKVIRHVRPKFACAGCDQVVEAPAPERAPSSAACQVPTCWPTCWFRNSGITSLFIASPRSSLAKASISIAPRWPAGLAPPASCSLRSSMRSGTM